MQWNGVLDPTWCSTGHLHFSAARLPHMLLLEKKQKVRTVYSQTTQTVLKGITGIQVCTLHVCKDHVVVVVQLKQGDRN